ncbi:MAG: glutamate racemase [Chthoniobacterales bacterium]
MSVDDEEHPEAPPSGGGPIGVFDSGIGGLTVVAALRQLLPREHIFYLGDTARVPYGGKSRRTIERYSVEIGGLLLAEHAKMIVVACNTASALALPRMKQVFKCPVLGVIASGAAAACRGTRNQRIGVIGTRATIASRAYEHAIHEILPDARVFAAACPLLVPLIEEGMFEDPITDSVLKRYLEPLVYEGIDTLVLGCTHYPLLRDAISQSVGEAVALVDSAQNCATAVHEALEQANLAASPGTVGRLEVALTDSTEGFLRLAEEALNLDIGDVRIRAVQAGE